MSRDYMGRYERRARKLINERVEKIDINWINISVQECDSGGAERVTKLLRDAGYKPDASWIIEEKKEAYINGTEKIRLPQETWILV